MSPLKEGPDSTAEGAKGAENWDKTQNSAFTVSLRVLGAIQATWKAASRMASISTEPRLATTMVSPDDRM